MSRSLAVRFGIWSSLLALFLTATPTFAQTDYFWNAPTGGSGNWEAATIWSTTSGGPVNYTWLNNGNERANFGNTAGTVTLGTGITAYGLNFTTTGYTITGNTLTLAGTGGPISVSTGTATINSIINSTVGLTKAGGGTLFLGGANTYSGVTAVNAGAVAVSTDAGLGATGAGNTTTVASGAALQVSGAITVAEAITLSGNGISNTGALLKTGANTTLWTGVITVTGGGARIQADAGTLDIRPGAINGISASGQTLTFGGNGNITIGGVGNILNLGTGTLNKEGPGTLTIENSNSSSAFVGSVNVTGGVLSVGESTSLGSTNPGDGGVITLNGGTLRNTNVSDGTSFITFFHPIVIGSNGGTVDVATADIAKIYSPTGTATISGAGNTLTKTGAGEFRYQNAGTALSSFRRLVVNQGLFRLGNVAGQNFETGFGAAPGSFLADAITLNGGAIGASFGVTLNANRGITLGAAGGTINVTTGAMTIPGAITGGGGLTILGDAVTDGATISGVNNYTGPTTITTSRLTMGPASTLPAGTAVTVNTGAELSLGGSIQTIGSLAGGGNVILGTNGVLITGNNTSTLYSGVMSSASGSLVKQGAGTLTLGGANTYLGGTTVTGGTLRIGAANALPTTGAVTLNGGTLSTGATTGFNQNAGALSVSDSSTIALGTGGHTLTFASFGTLGAGKTLTITGWAGSPGASGTAGKIIFTDPSGLTTGVLASITFTGDPSFAPGAMLVGNELVPVPVPEPGVVLAVAAVGLGLWRRRRRLS